MEGLEILFKNNTLISLRHELSVIDNRLMQLVFLDIQKNNTNIAKIPKESLNKIAKDRSLVSAKGLKNILDPLKQNQSKEVVCNSNDLEKTFAALETLRRNGIQIRTEDEIGHLNMVSAWKYDVKSGILTVEVPNMLIDFLHQYRVNGFTPINVTKYLGIGSTNAQRFYELLRRWTGSKKVIEYSLSDIKYFLKLEGKYKVLNDFKRRVIDPAIKELKERELLDIYKVEYVKKGRKVDTIKFYVSDLEPRNYKFNSDISSKEPMINEKDIETPVEVPRGYNIEDINIRLLVNYNVRISVNTLKAKQEEYREELFIKAIKILEDRVQDEQQDKLKAPVRYLTGILENLKNKSNQDIDPQTIQQPNKKSSFANFTQREYDYDKLENQLLGWDTDDDEDDE